MASLHGYGLMIADRRADAYAEALRRTVRPGSVVADVGTGTGIWAIHACRLGARRVYAIEPGDVIELAIETARANGCADRITFIRADAETAQLAEPADVVVADIRDVLPIAGRGVSGLMAARRWLGPSGVLIPGRDTLSVAVVHAPAAYRARVAPWDERGFGLDWSAVRRAALSVPRKERVEAADLLTPPAAWAEIDYATVTTPSVSGRVTLTAARAEVAHGLAVWFDSDLVETVRLSNRPGDPPLLYGQAFLPWPSPVALESGMTIDVDLRATSIGDDYVLRWTTVVTDTPTGRARARFASSTLDSQALSRDLLARLGPTAVVWPGLERDIDRFVLESFDGVRANVDIAAALADRFPQRFASPQAALARVDAVSLRLFRAGDRHD